MHRIRFIITICFVFPLWVAAQNEGNIWQFGFNAGLDFNTDQIIPKTDGQIDTWEGCSSVCDKMGNLLFYTNGVSVWNQNHEMMPNGDGLLGSFTSSQSALIVKKPGINSIYYIFTTDSQAGINGLRYSEVDMSLDGGLGDVTNLKNALIVTRVVEKVSAIRHKNVKDYWIVTHLWDSTRFHSYHLTENGLNLTPVASDVGSFVAGNGLTAMGYQKASQNGDRLAMAHGGFLFDVEVFDFNNATGEITNPIILDGYIQDKPYGIEFSPDGNLLYASIEGEPGTVYQYDLQAGSEQAIKDSRIEIGSGFAYGGALQLAPDGKIYHVGWDEYWMAAIENPNVLGMGCFYNLTGVYLNEKQSGIGLPNFPNSYLLEPALSSDQVCEGDTTQFTLNIAEVDSVFWDFGDPDSDQNNFSNELNPSHFYSITGSYIVQVTIYYQGTTDDRYLQLDIFPPPQVNLGNDTLLCEDNVLILNASTYQGYYMWQDHSIDPQYEVSKDGYYWVEVMANSCFASDTIFVERCEVKFEMPNVFTPNNDGKNDLFKPILYSDIKEAGLFIYNRWGELMYESNNVKAGWDGTAKGSKCATGTYFYVVNYMDFKGQLYNAKGSLTLLR